MISFPLELTCSLSLQPIYYNATHFVCFISIASLPNHAYIERIMLTSIPRRKEFSEQFQDLAQLHENSDVPLAKWDDASRLFPKQFGVPPLVAISIW